jgi:phospholipase C
MDYQYNRLNKKMLTGNIELALDNLSTTDHTIEVTDNAYQSKPIKHILKASAKGDVLVIDLQKSYGWYDFSVKVSGNHSFTKRYAGRVETGKASYTDPYMGRVIV